jgi:lipopolysaccharide/colanic/teichoic acid biosynthesis glycosyltransferase
MGLMDGEDYIPEGLSTLDHVVKRAFDLVFSSIGLLITWWIILLAYVAASIDTGKSGFFAQARVGYRGRLIKAVKIRTMRDMPDYSTNVTTDNDPRITSLGRFFRKTKIDELPQLWNVLKGEMSFVGPRPDVPGYADRLEGEDRIILSVRPGLTGPATLRFRNEEEILAAQDDPERYNSEVVFPEKVRLNRQYIERYSFWRDICYILMTLFGK